MSDHKTIIGALTPKLEAANRSEAEAVVVVVVVVWAKYALMLASRLLITAGTPGHMYLADRQEKCLQQGKKVTPVTLCRGSTFQDSFKVFFLLSANAINVACC